MAAPSLTYTLTNETTADASQVMQNFNDLLNGITDGTKDLTISALTCAGNASFQGNVTLGNGSVDDITVTGSLASTIPIKTNNSFDIGSSTLGLAGVYLGASGGFTTRLKAAATASWTFALPSTAGSAGQNLKNAGSGSTAWANAGASSVENLGLSVSVGSSALSIAIKGADGNDPSSSNPVYITFRNATATTGTPVTRTITSAVSMTVTSGADLGHEDALDQYVWVYAIDNSGTVELAVSGVKLFNDGSIQSTSGVGSGSDDGATLYSTSSRTNVPIRLIARLKSNQTTAGTWDAAISEVTLDPKPTPTLTEITSYTPTFTGLGTVSGAEVWYWRVGPVCHIRGSVVCGTTASSAPTISLPSSLSIDTGKVSSTDGRTVFGSVTRYASGSSLFVADGDPSLYLVGYDTASTTTIRIYRSRQSGALLEENGSSIFGNSEPFEFRAEVPIKGWSVYGP